MAKRRLEPVIVMPDRNQSHLKNFAAGGPGIPLAIALFTPYVFLIPAMLMARMGSGLADAIAYGGAAESTVALSLVVVPGVLLVAYLLAVTHASETLCGLDVLSPARRTVCGSVLRMLSAILTRMRLVSLLVKRVLQPLPLCEPTAADFEIHVAGHRLALSDCWISGASRRLLYE